MPAVRVTSPLHAGNQLAKLGGLLGLSHRAHDPSQPGLVQVRVTRKPLGATGNRAVTYVMVSGATAGLALFWHDDCQNTPKICL